MSVPGRRIERAVARFVREGEVLRRGERVLAAVSGGPDSSALLLILAALRKPLRIEVACAYFDHRLRGPEGSEAERAAVRALAGRAGVELFEGAGDVREEARRARRGVEDAARVLRYRFLGDTARAAGCGVVATGHTLDDQAETVLLHLVRGAGLRGLAGMRPRSSWPLGAEGPDVARPLLALRRAETRTYCEELGVAVVEDPTNALLEAARNRVRIDVSPALRTLNPRVEDALARVARAAAEAEETLDSLAAGALENARWDAQGVTVQRTALETLPPPLRVRALVAAWERLAGTRAGPSERLLRAMERVASGRAGATLRLPAGVRLIAGYDAVTMRKGPEPRAYPAGPVPLPERGEVSFGPWRIGAGVGPAPEGALVAVVDAEAVRGGLVVRTRRPGDRFQPAGMREPKKLQDFLVDEKVPREERDLLPLVASGRGIVWVVGWRIAEWARPREGRPTARLAAWRAPLRGKGSAR